MSFLGAGSVLSLSFQMFLKGASCTKCEASQRNVVTSGPCLQGFCLLSSGDGFSTERWSEVVCWTAGEGLCPQGSGFCPSHYRRWKGKYLEVEWGPFPLTEELEQKHN